MLFEYLYFLEKVVEEVSEQTQDSIIKKIEPKLLGILCLYLPAKNPYTTAKWYSELFGLEAASMAPLEPNAGMVVLAPPNGGPELFFIQSDDTLTLNFNNSDGYNHAVILFQVKDIEEVYERMTAYGVKLATDGIKDRGGCGKEIAFFDPDGRKVEISDYGTLR
jgi:predicted enzyme related to lactoylglutathione lyase